jgi:CBS domain-containing protein
MKVRRIMTSNVAACSPDTNLSAAAGLMWHYDCGVIPVIVGNQKVVGVITDRDICMAAAMSNRPASQIAVSEIISGEVFACAPEDEVSEALAIMQRRQVLRLPVVDQNGTLQGILSMNDIVLRSEEGRKSAGGGISYAEVVNTRKVIGQHREFSPEEGPPADYTEPQAMRA